jgi:hypothetical protein
MAIFLARLFWVGKKVSAAAGSLASDRRSRKSGEWSPQSLEAWRRSQDGPRVRARAMSAEKVETRQDLVETNEKKLRLRENVWLKLHFQHLSRCPELIIASRRVGGRGFKTRRM